MNSRTLGTLLIAAGLITLVVGLLVLVGGLSWFGRLPGDIRIERERFRLYVPITSMILLSVALTGLIYVIRRFID